MLRQFDHVVTCCESTGAHVVGVTCDLGGPNGRFMQRLGDNKKLMKLIVGSFISPHAGYFHELCQRSHP